MLVTLTKRKEDLIKKGLRRTGTDSIRLAVQRKEDLIKKGLRLSSIKTDSTIKKKRRPD